ncbi:hypothetical protein EXS57_00810 [Candidatus Kaiserbacteria bacterium]|nr:hypothetical protein [Candidatus Kaiserbacteria bacterium]
MSLQLYIGYAAGILGLIPYILFIRAMRKGTEKINLAGWILYDVSMLMIVASSIALNAWQSVWLAVAYLFGQSAMIVLSFRTGYFAFSRFDYGCIGLSLLGLLLWISTSNPLYALVLNVAVDALGTLSIAKKVYIHPGTEDTIAWIAALSVAAFNVFAVASFDVSNALYPVYLVFANLIIVLLSLRGAPRTDALANEAMDRGGK